MKTGILFDLDGTLMDTLEDLTDATNVILSRYGYSQRTKEEIRRFVGNGARRQIEQAAPEGADIDAMLADYKVYYADHAQCKTKPYPGVHEALAKLANDFPMAIVSNKPDIAVKSLCSVFFPGIYALGEKGDCPRKPAPDMIFRAMENIGVDRCIYVGDSEVDVITARNADVPCLSVLWGFRDREIIEDAGGNHFCEKTDDLADALIRMINGV